MSLRSIWLYTKYSYNKPSLSQIKHNLSSYQKYLKASPYSSCILTVCNSFSQVPAHKRISQWSVISTGKQQFQSFIVKYLLCSKFQPQLHLAQCSGKQIEIENSWIMYPPLCLVVCKEALDITAWLPAVNTVAKTPVFISTIVSNPFNILALDR